MKEQFVNEVQQLMLPYLNNEQLKNLQDSLYLVLSKYEIGLCEGINFEHETELVDKFISAKKIEGCSEKTLNYYRKTIETMVSGINKKPSNITTDDLRVYLAEYQKNNNSSKVTMDNIRRIVSTFFS